MATNSVEIVGDTCNLHISATNTSGADEISFLSGSFRSSPEERRVASVFFDIGGTKSLELRFEFFNGVFIETTIYGKPLYDTARF